MFSYFERLVDAFPDADPKHPPRTLFGFVWYYAKPIWPLLLLYAIGTTLISVAEVSLFGFLGSIVDWLSTTSRETFLRDEGWRLAGIAGVVLLALPALTFASSLISFQAIFGNFPMRFRWSVHNWLLGQSLGFFQDEFAGRISTKLMQTALAIRETVMKTIGVMLYVAVYFTGILVMIAAADWRLVLPFVAWLAIYILMLRHFIPKLMRVASDQADARAMMNGRIVDAYSNIGTVKLFAHTEREAVHARHSMEEFLVTVRGQARLINLFFSSLYALNSALLFSVGAIGIGLWTNELLSVGAIAVAIGLVLRLNGMSQWIMWEVSELFENIGTIRDGIATFTLPVALTDAPDARPLAVPAGEVVFDRVGFSYGRAAPHRAAGPVVEEFTLRIRPGEKIGLVGRSGAGKSTLLNLLLRFYDVESGRILIDGQDIAGVTQNSLRGAIGVVTQDTSLLHRTIGENILYGRPDATPADLDHAVERAEAAGFIAGLADSAGRRGLDAEVGERGVKLSGGQRQRIAIARVMLKDAPILLLDEATSALDSEVEAAIAENLYRLMEGKTVIAVAHRLSTIAALDRLIVIDRGRIIEEGSHAELIAREGLYASLWRRQAGGFLDAGDETAAMESEVDTKTPATRTDDLRAAE
ncbi:ABC transporter ATP-binding protein [Aureimonas sp. AU12]|uniref:ABC transporter ATP-binding protein n=1 Tax=Aureimonas sp. AU12 TaxID=1638161 RepID=UPI000781C75B|nr:ABC transporter ATP-binding protein [Aureimonas sp. AU12]